MSHHKGFTAWASLSECLRLLSWRYYYIRYCIPKGNIFFDYCFSSVTALSRGIWMSFFDTEEAHAVMLDKVADRGGRAALKVTPTSLDL
jgi:hypothetical protein